ncbi:MAG: hypothetical protein K0Q94_3688 [Paenibacillus sp.]|nr:hypothetical protein [Paenibacillus sp.]
MQERRTGPYRYVGYRLNKNMYNRAGVLIVPVHTVLASKDVELLVRQQVRLRDEDVERLPVLDLIETAICEVKSAFDKIRHSERMPLDRFHEKIIPIIVKMSEHPDLNLIFALLERKDEYTYRHSIGVALIAKLIGKAKGLPAQELLELTSAAFLHDIGKVKIPDDILNKAGKLTPREFELIQNHTIYGYELLKHVSGIPHRHALVALQHHEREDGSGYPGGLTGEAIDCHSKIVAVADVFHAMISKRVYKNPVPFYKVLVEMSENAYGTLEPSTTLCFLKRIMDMLIGNRVVLSNGDVGKIVMIHAADPIHPLVEVDGTYVDLSKVRTLHLERVI